MQRAEVRSRRVALTALLLVLLVMLSGCVDPSAGKKDRMTAEDLEKKLSDHDGAAWALGIGQFVPIAIGVALLIAWYLKRDKIKGGMIPPPPKAEPTYAFPAVWAYLLAIGAFLIAPLIVMMILAQGDPAAILELSLEEQILSQAVPTLALALLVILRRQRVRLLLPQQVPPHPVTGMPLIHPGTKPPGISRAFGLGWWTLCVAAVVVTPIALAWALLLHSLDQVPYVQETVQQVIESDQWHLPILMGVFGVIVAPLTEECIFRGLLYPATKHGLGGGRKGALWGILLVSGLFAAVHANLYALIPLFMLAVVLNWVFETTNSLAACIFAHAIFNALSLTPLLIYKYA